MNLKETALVIIDLQKGIAGREGFQPYSAAEIIEKNEKLVAKFANTEALIVFVHVKNYGPEAMKPVTDGTPMVTGTLPDDFSDFVIGTAYDKNVTNVIHVTKHNWGAFHGTDLDVQLRRRGIKNIILTGIATTIGVDTTAREAAQHGYEIVTVSDAMTDFNGELNEAIIKNIFPRLSKVRTTEEILTEIDGK